MALDSFIRLLTRSLDEPTLFGSFLGTAKLSVPEISNVII
jgi:hypothetical protein